MSGMIKNVNLFLFLFLISTMPAIASDIIVATGDDLVIYSRDIEILKEAYATSGFETTSKEYVDAMLKIRLFAKEALALGLGGPLAANENGSLAIQTEMTPSRFQKLHDFYTLYVEYLYDRYPISDAAIESYYLAFPEKTTRGGEASSAGDFFRPNTLDDEMKKMIRSKFLQNRKFRILGNEYHRLSEKYHVKVASGN